MNIWDLLILAAVACAVFFAVRGSRKRRSNSCGGSCSCCAGCPAQNKKEARHKTESDTAESTSSSAIQRQL